MKVRKIIAVATSVAALGGAALGLVPASAAGPLPDSVSCSFTGTTTSLTPINPPSTPDSRGAGGKSVFPPSTPNANAEEGTAPYTTADPGAFTFSGSTLSCTGTDSNGNTATAVSISSSGNYYNITCGTGTAYGTATLVDGNGATVATVSYTITFTNGQGTLKADVTIASDGVTIDAAGSVNIVPTQGDCATAPVTQFTVAGSATGSGTGDTDDAV